MGAKPSSSTRTESREVEAKAEGGKLQKETTAWEDILGEFLHDGYYEPDSALSVSGHRSAQIRMIEEILRFSSISDDPGKKPKSIVDVGCGLGGTSRYLAKKYDAHCKGITISPLEVQRAQARTAAEGLESKVSFEVADAIAQPFPDGQFDLVWCLEVAEHIADKEKFVHEMVRVAAPGATIALVSWCHRALSPTEESLKPEEMKLLKKIRDGVNVPPFCSSTDFVNMLKPFPLEDIKVAEWSKYASLSWSVILRSACSWKGITSLFKSSDGWETIKVLLAARKMQEAQMKGIFQLAIITCRKSE